MVGNYTVDETLPARVANAVDYFKHRLEYDEQLYESRTKARRTSRTPVPTIGFCGHSRAGKDTAALYVSEISQLTYPGSSSSYILPLLAHAVGVSPEQAMQERHNHSDFWLHFCNEFRRNDPTRLVRRSLAHGDMVTGIRSDVELLECKKLGVLDVTVWIENPRVQVDPTVEYSRQDCDLVIDNCGLKEELFGKLLRFVNLLRM